MSRRNDIFLYNKDFLYGYNHECVVVRIWYEDKINLISYLQPRLLRQNSCLSGKMWRILNQKVSQRVSMCYSYLSECNKFISRMFLWPLIMYHNVSISCKLMIFSLEETTMTKSEYLCSNRKFPTHGDQSKLNIVEILCYVRTQYRWNLVFQWMQ